MTGRGHTSRQLQPPCEVATLHAEHADLHGQCSGTVEHRLPWQSPTGPPLFSDRWDCSCHRADRPAGRSRTAPVLAD